MLSTYHYDTGKEHVYNLLYNSNLLYKLTIFVEVSIIITIY